MTETCPQINILEHHNLLGKSQNEYFCIFTITFHLNLYSKPSFFVGTGTGNGSQIEIYIIKSFSEHQCEQLLIYDHDDLTYLNIEINFLKKNHFSTGFELQIGF